MQIRLLEGLYASRISSVSSSNKHIHMQAFLLDQTADSTSWAHALLESRSSYASLREHFLKYCKHPEYLTAGNSDPLADDSNASPPLIMSMVLTLIWSSRHGIHIARMRYYELRSSKMFSVYLTSHSTTSHMYKSSSQMSSSSTANSTLMSEATARACMSYLHR